MDEEYENSNEMNEGYEEQESFDSQKRESSPEEISYEEEYEYEEVEANETEFNLTEDEINEWINELVRLRDEKGTIELDIDEENALKINYEEASEDEPEDPGESRISEDAYGGEENSEDSGLDRTQNEPSK